MTDVRVRDPDGMVALGELIGRRLRPGDVVSLVGPLGAGKTTLTRGIALGMGVTGVVASPTFVIARRHRGVDVDLVHCDAYRLAEDDDLVDVVGDPESVVTVVEWGDRVVGAIADSWLEIVVERPTGVGVTERDDARTVRLVAHGDDWDDRDVASWVRSESGGEP